MNAAVGPPKESGAAQTAPALTETGHHNHQNGFGCQAQVLTVGEKPRFPASPLSPLTWANKTRPTEKGSLKKGHSYKPLETEFNLGGFSYRQIARESNWAIYEQRWTGCAEPSVCYEVVRIRRKEATTFPSGRSYPAREVYPHSEKWGIDGFTLTDRDAAFDKLTLQLSPVGPANQAGPDSGTAWNLGTNTNTN